MGKKTARRHFWKSMYVLRVLNASSWTNFLDLYTASADFENKLLEYICKNYTSV